MLQVLTEHGEEHLREHYTPSRMSWEEVQWLTGPDTVGLPLSLGSGLELDPAGSVGGGGEVLAPATARYRQLLDEAAAEAYQAAAGPLLLTWAGTGTLAGNPPDCLDTYASGYTQVHEGSQAKQGGTEQYVPVCGIELPIGAKEDPGGQAHHGEAEQYTPAGDDIDGSTETSTDGAVQAQLGVLALGVAGGGLKGGKGVAEPLGPLSEKKGQAQGQGQGQGQGRGQGQAGLVRRRRAFLEAAAASAQAQVQRAGSTPQLSS